ncbi:hypothetical protein SAMN02746065_101269 [Desulfocicer vacuolatum DSM 3385]|uniref:Uncharacterized protein n=2 Tax=Desulfocicer vacuolatum TaxID=2298 RepID=A0A1W1YQ20_9BACT|nr:hypothetical protein SAMN02746065_101269 [Desulfocicer vacuolatum DSM 3385]
MSNYALRLIAVATTLVVATGIGFVVKAQLIPDSFGKYGHYRANAIDEEVQRPIRHGTNTSCLKCHTYEAAIHLKGRHNTISCEFCHGTYADHVSNGKKSGTLPVKKNTEISTLCLRCHNTEIKARSQAVIKTVAMPQHLESQEVKLTHTCNQCHHVHAPLKYINRAKQITGLTEAES